MTNSPSKKDLVRMVTKNLQHHLMKHLIIQPLSSFGQLFDAKIQIEDAIQIGIFYTVESVVMKPKRFGGNSKPSNVESSEVHAIDMLVLQSGRRSNRELTLLGGMPLSEVLERLVKAGHWKPLEPMPTINPLPPNYNPN